MSIVKNTDFTKGRFKIPNATDIAPDSDLIGNKSELGEFIEEFEEEALILTLGYTLYAEFKTQLDPSNSNGLIDGADQKWDDLLNGKENYFGLKKLLVPYIYFQFLENDESQYSGTGVIKESTKGARSYSERGKAVKAWRSFYQFTIGRSQTPNALTRPSIFGNLTMYDWYGTSDDKYKPLYVFLREEAETYPTAVPTMFENMNYYGI